MAESDHADTPAAEVELDCPMSSVTVVVNELLCFLQQKGDVMAADDIIKVCVDFYARDEIETARSSLLRFVNQKRLPKQKGTDRDSSMRAVTMMLKLCLDPSVNLPQFCAVNLARLPPVDIDHLDVSALLSELSALRREVRATEELRNEVRQLKEALVCNRDLRDEVTYLTSEIKNVRTEIDSINRNLSTAGSPSLRDWPPLDVNNQSHSVRNVVSEAGAPTAAVQSKSAPTMKSLPKKRVHSPVFGSSTANNHVKSVVTTRCVEVFVSRLHPETHSNELVDCVRAINNDIHLHDVSCEKLKSKYESLYSSFHVSIRVDTVDLKRAIDLYMKAESWPAGVFVKRFFTVKDGSTK